jgi:hypothetical protein
MESRIIQATILTLGGLAALVTFIRMANAWVTALEAATDTLANTPREQDLGEFLQEALSEDEEDGLGPDYN